MVLQTDTPLSLQAQLQSLQQGRKSCTNILHEVKVLTDQLVAVGRPILDDDLIGYVQRGLTLPLILLLFSVHLLCVQGL